LPLYERYNNDIAKVMTTLKGQFSFVLYDSIKKQVVIGRDAIGVTPLYYGTNHINKIVFASEMKCLVADNDLSQIKIFYPRQYGIMNLNSFDINFFSYLDLYEKYSITLPYTEIDRPNVLQKINEKLTKAVKSQVSDLLNEEDGFFGVLLSGGLDSSLIASLVSKQSLNKKIHTFSIGVNANVPDLVAARQVAEYLGTEHHEYYFSIQEGIDNLENVIWYTETYDCTTIRASTPMYLLAKAIKQDFPKMKVLFSGELSDELLCYLYGANAPNETEFQMETIDLVNNVHLFDCLRANKTCMAHSLEIRVPFTDIEFVDYILSLHPKWKMFGKDVIEKKILRDAFVGYLPEEILYRKKEQFSDGVSGFSSELNWIDSVKEFANNMYSNEAFMLGQSKYSFNTPDTKEKLLYRDIFNDHFGRAMTEYNVKQWVPKWSDNNDPSGRVQKFWYIKNN
jgi:asparagine synthase (glutamine-hydrolysing)